MGDFFDQMPEHIQDHIRLIARDFEIPDAEDTLEAIAKVWIGKKEIFERQIESSHLEEVDALAKDDDDGALLLTYSGSLVDISPLINGHRGVTYTSIGYRINTPAHAECSETNLVRDLMVDSTAEFDKGPIKRTSQVYKIAVCRGELDLEDKASSITATKTIIEDEFLEVNKTLDLG